MNIYFCFYFKIARDVVTILLISFDIYHIATHKYKGTHMQAHRYDQLTRGMSTTRHRSLVGRCRRIVFC